MNLVILKNQQLKNLEAFIDSWSRFYSYANEDIYSKVIVKELFITQDIQNLFQWKNGMKLSVIKTKIFRH